MKGLTPVHPWLQCLHKNGIRNGKTKKNKTKQKQSHRNINKNTPTKHT